MKSRTILISGASIAGPALAYWLGEYGFDVTIVERAPALREGGYKIDIRQVAISVVKRMGIFDDIRLKSTEMKGASFVDAKGKTLAEMSADLLGMREGEDVEIMRGDLSKVLYDASKDHVEYIFDDSINSITQSENGVDVTFERSAPRNFDIVVGADGVHSNVRSLIFGDESKFVNDLGHYVAIFTTPNHLNLDRWELFYAVPKKTTNVYSTHRSNGAKALFVFSSPMLEYDRRDIGQQKKILADVFNKESWEVPKLLETMWDAHDFYFDRVSQICMDHWSKGRVVLLGDSAYGPSLASGQGTSLALVGAYVLAGELKAADGDYTAAFQNYEREMQVFVEKNQKLGTENIKQMVGSSPLQIWFQILMLKLMPKLHGARAAIEKIRQSVKDAANGIVLKEY